MSPIWTIVRCHWTTFVRSAPLTKVVDRLSAEIPDSGRASSSPARACALAVLRRVFEDGAWADRALHGEARRLGLDARERALAMRLAYGAVQRRATLDHLIEALAGRPVGQLEPLVLAALRLGLYQLAYLGPRAGPRGRRRVGRAGQARLARRREARQRGAAARRARGARSCVAALGDATPARGRAAPLAPRVDRGAVVGRARARTPRGR